ncbi:hypothetical protein PspLS_06277 [Pyricularia sp. CBS 133598]|nr:hypothetical protein PspLS_06277 [Pyricularia sp. CBS 133598]
MHTYLNIHHYGHKAQEKTAPRANRSRIQTTCLKRIQNRGGASKTALHSEDFGRKLKSRISAMTLTMSNMLVAVI